MVTAPTNRNRPAAASPTLKTGSIASLRSATASTGTNTLPSPSFPATPTSTLYEPAVMSHSSALYSPGSPGTGPATSGGGAPSSPTSDRSGRTVTRSTPSPSRIRTDAWARPGITPGVRTITRTSYGPAAPSK